MLVTLCMLPAASFAASATCPSGEGERCTCFTELKEKAEDKNQIGVLTEITDYIKQIVLGVDNKGAVVGPSITQQLFEAFTQDSSYGVILNTLVMLSVILYAIGFMFGFVQANFGTTLIRLIKIGLIYTILSPSGWAFFNNYVVTFFQKGTDDLIRLVLSIGSNIPVGPNDPVFAQVDKLSKFFFDPDLIVAILGTLTEGPYGLSMGVLIGFCLMQVLRLFLEALKVYAITLVMRALLLGVAPIFIVFILFDRTKSLFTGWVNVLVNLSLKPILYFTFLSFFIVMIMSAATDMFGVTNAASPPSAADWQNSIELCWTETKGGEGTVNKQSSWKLKRGGQQFPDIEPSNWFGSVSCQLNGGLEKDGTPCKTFPIDIISILTFLILVTIAKQFADVVDSIANEISNSMATLDRETKMDLRNAAKSNNQGAGGQ